MAVPHLTDEKTLSFYGGTPTTGTGTSPSQPTPLKAQCTPSGIARYDWNDGDGVAVQPGEEFSLLARYLVPAAWTGGGGTILRIESYAATGQILCRLEVDVFRDGRYHIVRNAHANMGDTIDYEQLGATGPPQVVGKQYDLALHAILDAGNKGMAELFVDGARVIGISNVKTWYDATKFASRCRFCMVQGPAGPNPVKCDLYASELAPGFKVLTGTTPQPDPPKPEPPPVDPCATEKALIVTQQKDLNAMRAKLNEIHGLSA